jgi:hypothetical protein
MGLTTQQQLALLRAVRKGAKAATSLGSQRPPAKDKQVKGGGACRKCPKVGRRGNG